jgi:hypothetical protein
MSTNQTTPEELAARLVANRRAWDADKIDFKKFRERQRDILAAAERAGFSRGQVLSREQELAK